MQMFLQTGSCSLPALLQSHHIVNPGFHQLRKDACLQVSVQTSLWAHLKGSAVVFYFLCHPPRCAPHSLLSPFPGGGALCSARLFLSPGKRAERSASSPGILQDHHFHSRLYKMLFLYLVRANIYYLLLLIENVGSGSMLEYFTYWRSAWWCRD